MKTINYSLTLFLFFFTLSCVKDDDNGTQKDIIEIPAIGTEAVSNNITTYDYGNFNEDILLINDMNNDSIFSIKRDGSLFKAWNKNNQKAGVDIVLEKDGNLLAALHPNTLPIIVYPGGGGDIKLFDKNNSILWDYQFKNDDQALHHDIQRLPNGNVLAIVWKKMKSVQEEGSKFEALPYLVTESIIEINPTTNKTVWEWNSHEHFVQDYAADKLNYGNVNGNPQLIDLNYPKVHHEGDLIHANAIEYDKEKDLIYLSVNYYNEIWVIDHSTSTDEAKTHTGGHYNMGGDLVYRFGNPAAYKDTANPAIFSLNHSCNFIPNGLNGAGNMLVFVNGLSELNSKVLELKLPNTLEHKISPEVIWEYQDKTETIFSQNTSSAFRLKNGNTLVTYGNYGIREVTPNGKKVWEYKREGAFFWRTYSYEYDSDEIQSIEQQ